MHDLVKVAVVWGDDQREGCGRYDGWRRGGLLGALGVWWADGSVEDRCVGHELTVKAVEVLLGGCEPVSGRR